ncbi:hypothetical protein IFM89_002944 [Coptis chinensis]|uniref:Uncharacterized protein n=1 Tax=Coptis chinensis TaxID=261450 RepID=A0A835IKP9_9MAGN|nr:hypothetical protein IFM89_002944 [Coptis chinensis]
MAADKMGSNMMLPPFYGQTASAKGLVIGLDSNNSQGTIKSTGNLQFEALNIQLRQLLEALQVMQLQLGQSTASELVQSSLFYISLNKDDYVQVFMRDFSSLRLKYGVARLAHILVKEMTRVIKEDHLYGMGPLGCAPNYTNLHDNCNDEINEVILQYNVTLSERLQILNYELLDAEIVFCDMYKGMMKAAQPRRWHAPIHPSMSGGICTTPLLLSTLCLLTGPGLENHPAFATRLISKYWHPQVHVKESTQ